MGYMNFLRYCNFNLFVRYSHFIYIYIYIYILRIPINVAIYYIKFQLASIFHSTFISSTRTNLPNNDLPSVTVYH